MRRRGFYVKEHWARKIIELIIDLLYRDDNIGTEVGDAQHAGGRTDEEDELDQ